MKESHKKIILGCVGVLVIVAGIAIFSGPKKVAVVESFPEDQIKRGEYLATAGDCVACHTGPDGMPFAGGLPMHTPFGTLYSTNITPDLETGIGNYDFSMFKQAVVEGKGNVGYLYPAMPFASYAKLTDEDLADLYAYFKSIKPVELENQDNDIAFPFNLRFGLGIWTELFVDSQPIQHEDHKSASWNRGNYLINSLGHCGECHTPRNLTQNLNLSQHFEGNVIGGFEASDITPERLVEQGWTHDSLAQLFRTGYSELGTVFGEMSMVVVHSLSRLNQDDMNAVTEYLLDQPVPTEAPAQISKINRLTQDHPEGKTVYNNQCAACHGFEGEGKPNIAPAMQSNATLNRPSVYNSVAVLLRGIPTQTYNETTAFYKMDSFESLTDQEMADLINYMRAAWTDMPADIDADQVEDIRDDLDGQDLIGKASSHAEH